MSEWTYIERKVVRAFIVAIFAFGEIFLLMVVAIVFSNLFKGREESVAFNVLIVILSILFWNGVGLYWLSNTASALILRDDTITVVWSKNRVSTYPWQKIKIRNVGSSSDRIVLVNDDNWKFGKLTLPRIIVLDGSSGEYKELITRIRQKTEGTNSPIRGKA
jgi:ABC-type transport system involved in multi-copper enzyme maturation permease subunit